MNYNYTIVTSDFRDRGELQTDCIDQRLGRHCPGEFGLPYGPEKRGFRGKTNFTENHS